MPKRPTTEREASQSKSQASGSGDKPISNRRPTANGNGEIGEFEDAWEDEVESDEVLGQGATEHDESDDSEYFSSHLYAVRCDGDH